MKRFFTLLLMLTSLSAISQTQNSILEQRAKDFHQAILKDSKDAWRSFMKENFTTALIERPMRAQVATSENDGAGATNTTSSETNFDAKVDMFQQLHDDFGKSKLSSLKVTGNQIEMVLNSDNGMKGIFSLEAEATSPWRIDKMGIEVDVQN